MTRIAFETTSTSTMNPSKSAIQTITKLAQALDTQLDQQAIESIVTLLENGVHPDALAALIIEFRRNRLVATSGSR